jgi:hypothetical protein
MKKRLLLATCAWLLTLSGTVYSQGPATVAVGGVVAGEFLDKAESSANRLMEQARTEADYVLFQFAQNMLMLIQRGPR